MILHRKDALLLGATGATMVAMTLATCWNMRVEDQLRLPGLSRSISWDYQDSKDASGAKVLSVYSGIAQDGPLIFQGVGGHQPRVAMIGPDTLLLRYCGGRRLAGEGSFPDKPEGMGMPYEARRRIKLIVINTDRPLPDGRVLCPSRG